MAASVTEGALGLAAYVDAAVPMASPEDSAGEVLARLAGQRFAAVDPVFVLGEARRFLGAVPLTDLLAAQPGTRLETLLRADWPAVPATLSRQDAASIAIRSDAPALAVLDHAGGFLGALAPQSVMGILRAEHLEDLHHMVGILGRSDQARAALTAAPHRRALYRLPWLLVGLAGASAATGLMAGAEEALSANIAIAFFIPAIVYLADAIGTQAEAVAVRGLSLTDGSRFALLLGELGTGALLGLTLGVVALFGVWAAFGHAPLALAVALALAAAGTLATGIGFLLPWAFHRAGLDPAHGAGPLATVIQDVLSIAVYLGLVTVLVV